MRALVIVLDTNVLISGLTSPDPLSPVSRVVRLWLGGEFEVATSPHILGELQTAARNRYFRRRASGEELDALSDLVAQFAAVRAVDAVTRGAGPHASDDEVLALVASGGIDYLVTGDKELLAMGEYEGVPIINPSALLEVLEA
jgi:putative PIN family toxin of toxin-antitoxin system